MYILWLSFHHFAISCCQGLAIRRPWWALWVHPWVKPLVGQCAQYITFTDDIYDILIYSIIYLHLFIVCIYCMHIYLHHFAHHFQNTSNITPIAVHPNISFACLVSQNISATFLQCKMQFTSQSSESRVGNRSECLDAPHRPGLRYRSGHAYLWQGALWES